MKSRRDTTNGGRHNANQITEDYVTGKRMTAERNLYSYDANGNQSLVLGQIGSTARSRKEMPYDIFNRQLSWTLSKPDGQGGWIAEKSESSAYRGDKWHRTSSTSNGVTTSYLYDGDNVIADIVNGSVVKSYVTPLLDSNISLTDYSDSQNLKTYYYNQDERQSVKNLTDSTGGAVQSYDYTAYGDKVDALTNGNVDQRYTYTGRELNEVSGDYYFRYRMYGAGLGGFLSRDMLGYIDGMSMYSGYFAVRLMLDGMGMSIISAFDGCACGFTPPVYYPVFTDQAIDDLTDDLYFVEDPISPEDYVWRDDGNGTERTNVQSTRIFIPNNCYYFSFGDTPDPAKEKCCLDNGCIVTVFQYLTYDGKNTFESHSYRVEGCESDPGWR